MATPKGGKETPFGAGVIDFVARGLSPNIAGVNGENWFGPGQPLPAVGPKDLQTRIYDYQFGVNLLTQQTDQGISFGQLRALADSYDLLRLVIETRKDQMEGLTSGFRLRRVQGESVDKRNKRSQTDPRVKALNEMFRYPDGERDFKTWLRAFLEEVFVIDALSLAPRYMLDGSISGVDVIDGATIVRKIDEQGRTPVAPSVAYQQILKGLPAKDLTTRDLMYKPRNYRANRMYGYSPVEQIIVTINMALRRQQTQLSNFTEGNIPEAIASVPETWTKEDIQRFQEMFDNMSGDIAKKQRMRFVPKLDGIVFSKEKMLADKFDEWLARITCFAFSISPQPFVEMMNRATADTAGITAKDEGIKPTADFVSGVLTQFVDKYVLLPDIEHAFLDDEESDKLKQAQIDRIYIGIGKNSIDEVRTRDGEEPIGMAHAVIGAAGPIPLAPFLDGGPMAEGLPNHVNPVDPNAVVDPDDPDPPPGKKKKPKQIEAGDGEAEKLAKAGRKKY